MLPRKFPIMIPMKIADSSQEKEGNFEIWLCLLTPSHREKCTQRLVLMFDKGDDEKAVAVGEGHPTEVALIVKRTNSPSQYAW